jgi:CheY-like chemotaxis protein
MVRFRILLADDEPINLMVLTEALAREGYDITTASHGQEAWEILTRPDNHFNVVILDRVMPGLDGLELLKRIKASPELHNVPVILQTALGAKEEVLEGIREGAFYYFSKPVDPDVFKGIVRSATQTSRTYRGLQQEVHNFARSLPLLQAAEFQFRTLAEAKYLSNLLASACPDPERVVCGLMEVLVNAIEHGNLGMGYQKKSTLTESHRWREEVARALDLPENRDKRARASFERKGWGILVTVSDDGPGFDWQKFLEFDPARVFDSHGRGIAMARLMSFDGLTYVGNGSTAIITILGH